MKGLKTFINTLRSRNFTSPVIMSDGEGAIGALQEQLNALGIEVDMTTFRCNRSQVEVFSPPWKRVVFSENGSCTR